jgi:hypothetical protein
MPDFLTPATIFIGAIFLIGLVALVRSALR